MAVPLSVAVGELLHELEPVLDDDAPTVTDAVGEIDTVLLPLTVVLDVTFAVPLHVGVPVPEGVAVGVAEPVGEDVMDTVPVLEAEAPTVTELVGLCDSVELPLSVEEGVCAGLPVPV